MEIPRQFDPGHMSPQQTHNIEQGEIAKPEKIPAHTVYHSSCKKPQGDFLAAAVKLYNYNGVEGTNAYKAASGTPEYAAAGEAIFFFFFYRYSML